MRVRVCLQNRLLLDPLDLHLEIDTISAAVLGMHVECPAALVEVDPGGLRVTVGQAGESHRGLGGLMLATLVGHRHPNVVAPRFGWKGSTWIFCDVEIPVLIQREVIRHLEIGGRVESLAHIVVDEGGLVLAPALRLPEVDTQDTFVGGTGTSGYGDIEDIGATPVVSRRGRDLDVLGTVIPGGSRSRGRDIRVHLYRGSIQWQPHASPVRSPVGVTILRAYSWLVKWRLAKTGWRPKDGPGQRSGVAWHDGALYDLALAARAGGPMGAAAATSGARFLLPDRVEWPYLVREVGPSLLRALAAASEVPDTIQQFHRGRLASWLGLSTTADRAFSAYRASGGSPDRAALELARIRLPLAQPGADSLYFGAASSPDPVVKRELRSDLAFVADTAELAAYDASAVAERPAWLRRFWEGRDLESLRPRGSRLREHYRRLGVARERFRLLVYPRQYELYELWQNRSAEYDDRGLVYIRHGEPDQTAQAVRAGACSNTSWLYRRPEGNMVFHFVARQNPTIGAWWRRSRMRVVGVAPQPGCGRRGRRASAGPSTICSSRVRPWTRSMRSWR